MKLLLKIDKAGDWDRHWILWKIKPEWRKKTVGGLQTEMDENIKKNEKSRKEKGRRKRRKQTRAPKYVKIRFCRLSKNDSINFARLWQPSAFALTVFVSLALHFSMTILQNDTFLFVAVRNFWHESKHFKEITKNKKQD